MPHVAGREIGGVMRRAGSECGPVYRRTAGETMSWARLREVLSVQRRVTATFRQRDGRTPHVRKATVAEPALRKIYDALGIEASPGGVQRFTAETQT